MEYQERKKIISQVADGMDVTKYIHYSDLIATLYRRTKKNIENYSYLLFSEDLGFGHNNYTRLVAIGQRTLTDKALPRILEAMNLKGPRRRYFEKLVQFVNSRNSAQRDELFSDLMREREKATPGENFDVNTLRYIERWYLPIIREMTVLSSFDGDPAWIQQHLSFPVHLKEIRYALKSLVELGLLEKDNQTEKYKRTAEKVHSPNEMDSIAAIRFHQKMIDLGKDSILRIKPEMREVVGQTVSIPTSAVPLLKRHIKKLLDTMEAMEDGSDDCEVFQLNVQLFPVTTIGRNKE